jgi:hypothetical protein
MKQQFNQAMTAALLKLSRNRDGGTNQSFSA